LDIFKKYGSTLVIQDRAKSKKSTSQIIQIILEKHLGDGQKNDSI
jgi:hypothetical protein